MTRFSLFALSSLVAISTSSACFGQATNATGGSGASRSARDTAVGEIIVTAQRRAARSKDVPIALTVLSRESLKRSNTISSQGLTEQVPGLRMNASGSLINPTLRGVTSSVGFLSEPNVSTYVDNVYQASNFVGFIDLPDVESIQVLKGPQGTLFGRNATGGAILVKTRDPQFTPSGEFVTSYGRFGDLKEEGFATAPLVNDLLAASIAGYYEYRDPYMKNLAPHGHERGLTNGVVRAKLRLKPAEGVDFILTGLYADKTNGDAATYGNLNGNNPERGVIPTAQLASGRNQFASDLDLYFKTITQSISLGGQIAAGPGVITTTTAYAATQSPNLYDADNTPLPLVSVYNNGHTSTLTQEVLYTFKGIPRFNGTVGAFYFQNQMYYDPLYYGPFASIRTSDRDHSFGIFSELSYDLTDRLQLTGGLRYNWERRQANVGFAGPYTPVPDNSIFRLGEKLWTSFTPRVSVLYRLSKDTNLFATYSKGFKSGVFNTYAAQAKPVDPEKLTAYEVGVKSAHRGFDFSLSGFYYDYKDIQVSSFSGFTQLLQNAASARNYGADFTLSIKPTPELSVTAAANYLNARYQSFTNASVYVPKPVSPLPAGISPCAFASYTPAYDGNTEQSCDVTGNHLPLSPEFSASLGATYRKEISAGVITATASGYYTTKFFFEPLNRLSQDAYFTLGGKLSFSPARLPNLEVSLYGENLTDARIFETVLVQSADTFRYQVPATYGVELRYGF